MIPNDNIRFAIYATLGLACAVLLGTGLLTEENLTVAAKWLAGFGVGASVLAATNVRRKDAEARPAAPEAPPVMEPPIEADELPCLGCDEPEVARAPGDLITYAEALRMAEDAATEAYRQIDIGG